jgi:hypothetical protein
MKTAAGDTITFAEWGYLGKGKFQRRDFHLDSLTEMSKLTSVGSLFGGVEKHDVFTPFKTYPPMTIADIAKAEPIVVKSEEKK